MYIDNRNKKILIFWLFSLFYMYNFSKFIISFSREFFFAIILW